MLIFLLIYLFYMKKLLLYKLVFKTKILLIFHLTLYCNNPLFYKSILNQNMDLDNFHFHTNL